MTTFDTILVTGAAGFIGSHVVDRLLARGDHVIGLDNFDPFYPESEKRNNLASAMQTERFTLLELDCRDVDGIAAALASQKLSAVVHLAARAGVRPSIADPVGYASTNVLGTQCMLEVARRMDVSRFVFASSSSVYGNNATVPFKETDAVDNPISPYAATKRAGELLCHTYNHLFGITTTALRFFTVYGPRQRPDLAIRKFAGLILDGKALPIFGDGSSARDYTWIDDIVAGVLAAIDRTRTATGLYDIINLGGNRTTTLARLVSLLGDAAGVAPIINRSKAQPGDVERTFASVEHAQALLGYEPKTPIEEGIPRFMEWMLARRP